MIDTKLPQDFFSNSNQLPTFIEILFPKSREKKLKKKIRQIGVTGRDVDELCFNWLQNNQTECKILDKNLKNEKKFKNLDSGNWESNKKWLLNVLIEILFPEIEEQNLEVFIEKHKFLEEKLEELDIFYLTWILDDYIEERTRHATEDENLLKMDEIGSYTNLYLSAKIEEYE